MNKNGTILLFSSDQGTEDVETSKSNGVIIIYSYPVDTRNNSKRIEINSHFNGINDMIFSPDEQNLFTAGKDNCLIIWNVKEREINYTREKESTLPWATELLISAEAKKSQQDKKRTLQNDIQESK